MPEKADLYERIAAEFQQLVGGEVDLIANMANGAALLRERLADLNWVGFYRAIGAELVLGPFQGRPACIRIGVSRGVCGAAATRQETIVVPDVSQFADHIVCDSVSRSELVVPLVVAGRTIGVLDLDSPTLARFDSIDAAGLERFAAILLRASQVA